MACEVPSADRLVADLIADVVVEILSLPIVSSAIPS
jgi:hypothetical protein